MEIAMDKTTQTNLDHLRSQDREFQNKAFTSILNATEKNCTLIRYDILQSLRNVYDAVKDEKIKEKALELIEIEKDPKYREKYVSLWKAGK
jgi:hypothetical protein